MLSRHTNTMLDLTNYCALKFNNFKAQLKFDVHYRNAHAYAYAKNNMATNVVIIIIE